VYAAAAERFAQRHAEAGGRAYTYRIDWGSTTNGFGATHAIDLPLLFSDERAWSDADILKGMEWDEIDTSGRAVRELWARFASTGHLPDRGRIKPNVLSYGRIPRRGLVGEAPAEPVSALDRQAP
jgi:para-nitrobenzyl esterase